jgi:hypothetical protein
MIAQTSLEAFESIKKELGKRQMDVYLAIKQLGEADNLTISKFLGLPINSITPRCQELRSKKLVGVSKIGKSKYTGRNVICWKCVR